MVVSNIITINVIQQTYAYNVTFYVTDAYTGYPIAGALVELVASSGTTYYQYTNTSGYAYFTGIPQGSYSCSISHTNYKTVNFTVNVNQNLSLSIQLYPSSTTGPV
jgi:hypothetical protein